MVTYKIQTGSGQTEKEKNQCIHNFRLLYACKYMLNFYKNDINCYKLFSLTDTCESVKYDKHHTLCLLKYTIKVKVITRLIVVLPERFVR